MIFNFLDTVDFKKTNCKILISSSHCASPKLAVNRISFVSIDLIFSEKNAAHVADGPKEVLLHENLDLHR